MKAYSQAVRLVWISSAEPECVVCSGVYLECICVVSFVHHSE